MSITRPLLATRDEIKVATDIAYSARMDRRVDRAAVSGTEAVEQLCHRTFHPVLATRTFNWPDHSYSEPWILRLDENELAATPTAITIGGAAATVADFNPEPANSGPPFTRIEANLSTSAAWSSGDTSQRAVGITSLFGYSNVRTAVGALTGNMGASGTSGLQLSPTVGAGSLLWIDAEGIIVTDKSMVNTGQTLGGAGLGVQPNDQTVPVSDGTAFEVDETLLLGAERMLVIDIAANNLIVKRGYDGTVTATHAAATPIFALAGFTVLRGQVGTTAATHSSGATVYRWEPPGGPRDLALAEAINQLEQESSAYARMVGSGESTRLVGAGGGLADKRKAVWASHARKAGSRKMAV